MRPNGYILIFLMVLLVLMAAITISSRMWMLTTHRQLVREKQKYRTLLDEEHALQVELVSRTDVNTIERRARQELGMQPLRYDQWRVLRP